MLYDPATAPQLKPWLVRTLEPICDAEPGALAEYILALLKHNVPEQEMRQELAVQLDEFLEKECVGFIDTLFTVLRTKSYVPYAAGSDSPPLQVTPLGDPAEGIPIPLDGLLAPSSERPKVQLRSRKRSNTGSEEDGRPHKGPRLNNDGSFQRYGDGTGRGWLGFGGVRNGPMVPFGAHMNGMGMNGRPPLGYQPPDQKRGICRDYHNNGYCARGLMCKYSHGEDAVVPGQLYPGSTPIPFMPMFPGNMPFVQGGAYDPHEARMDMRPRHQRAPLLPRIQHEDGRVVHPVVASGELPVIQDLTPNIPTPNMPPPPSMPTEEPLPSGDHEMQNPTSRMAPLGGIGGFNPVSGPPVMNGHQYPLANGPIDVDPSIAAALRPQTQSRGFRGRGRGGRGTFGGEVHSFRPEKRQDRTLVVEKIPEDKLSLDQVNEWFKRFGTVTNVAIDSAGGKALVSFEKHEEAHAAWRSEEAVFGNRFVKVFWHRPLEGHGQVGARMLAASAPLVANMASKDKATAGPSSSITTANSAPTTTSAATPTSASTAVARKVSSAHSGSSVATALAAKQQLLEQKIVEQKALMASLEKASAEEKKELMAQWRKLNEEMTQLTSSSSTADTPKAPTTNGSIASSSKAEKEKKEKERLDKELDMHHKVDELLTTEELKAKLEKLKAEAASLGLDSALSSATVARGGYRGRPPRGRGYFRGVPMRGGPPRASMKLDNRPKKLLVKGVGKEQRQALRDWYETTGQLESVEHAEHAEDIVDAYIVSFKSRSGAEQGLAKGSNVPTVGSVQIAWFTGKESTNSVPIPGAGSSSSISGTAMKKSGVNASVNGSVLAGVTESHVGDRSPVHHRQEEEVVASGWGGDGDGDEGDGMGML